MSEFNYKKYLKEGKLLKEEKSTSIDLRTVKKILTQAGHKIKIEKNGLFDIKSIEFASKNPDEQEYGSIKIYKNGDVEGTGLYGSTIKSEQEVLAALDEFIESQIKRNK